MASEETRIEKLLNQCRSNDVDVKVDALSKLQVEFENGAEIEDVDTVLSLLKACLRTSNQHLTNATLNAIPPLLPLIITRSAGPLQSNSPLASSTSGSSGAIDVPTLRQAFSAFMSTGGIIDRLGDKERAQAKARESIILLGGYAFRAGAASVFASRSGKGAETPIMVFERVIKENGLASKVWKVREQSILVLLHSRRAHPQFPVRPYLSLLVDCLEDTDAHVRDCAKTSVIELFSGPHVTDAARADLKKEMTKKNVRKTIVDGVLSKLLSAPLSSSTSQSQNGSDYGDAGSSGPKEYLPPSLMLAGKRPRVGSQGSSLNKSTGPKEAFTRPDSRGAAPSPPPQSQTPGPSDTTDVRPAYIASVRDLESEFAAMAKPFEGKESEHNWAARDAAVQRVRGMLKGEVHVRYTDAFYACLKEGFVQWSLKTLASLRTTVAMNTCALYSELIAALGTGMDPFCDMLLPPLLKMAGFTKKITATQSQVCVTDILTRTSAPSRLVMPLLWSTLQEKTVQARAHVVAHMKTYMDAHGNRSRNAIEASGGVETLEKAVKKALADPNPMVKEASRRTFWAFDAIWHESAMAIMDSLDSMARKQLEKACPQPGLVEGSSSAGAPAAPKKSSIAAAIAASRAKAKAIANAPPSLRHQATSSSAAQTPVARREISPGSRSPKGSTVPRPSSPLRTASTPGSPPLRTPAAQTSRSVSSSAVPIDGSHSRTASSNSSKRARSPSELSDHQFGTRRRTSSPLVASPSNNMNTLRKAMQTALPASPPQSSESPARRIAATLRANPGLNMGHLRQSIMLPNHGDMHDESLLMAQAVPIPEGDSDSDDEHSMNLMSFTAAYDQFPQQSPARSLGSKPTASISNALSSGSLSDMMLGSGDATAQQPVVEDALRARAEQAESAAERLLELVDENDLQEPIAPMSLASNANDGESVGLGLTGLHTAPIGNGNGTVRAKDRGKPAPIPLSTRSATVPPVTPKPSANARASAIMKQAAMFQDSPVAGKKKTSLLDALHAQRHETGWWLKRSAMLAKPSASSALTESERLAELKGHITLLETGEIFKEGLQKLALLCLENPVRDSGSLDEHSSPSPFFPQAVSGSSHSDLWDTDRMFSKLFGALMAFLQPSKEEDVLEYALIIVWEMLENQGPYLEGREADLFSVLLRVRFCNKVNVLEATSTLRDALTSKIDPIYGLTTFHGCLRSFQAEQTTEDPEVKAATTAFGLIALGKFILRLPAEIAEEELPRLKGTLIAALNDRSSLVVRESAAAAIISAQLVLKDETQLFTLLDGLADDKKNLLTYLFDKHGARARDVVGEGADGIAKFQKEIRRLDTRTSTPSRGTPRG